MKSKFLILSVYALLILLVNSVQAQDSSHHSKPVTQRINAICGGYYEFLPYDYTDNNNTYPLLIDIHGMGAEGSGSQGDLASILSYNTPYYISKKRFPISFILGHQSFSFIVIAPQFSTTATGRDVEDVLNFIKSKYRIDPSRIYVTGYSRGGEPTWRFPCLDQNNSKQIAALVPVAGINSDPTHDGVENIVASDLPVWALHSVNDEGGTTPVQKTINFINAINALEPKTPALFTPLSGSHSETCWEVYDPASKFPVGEQNLSIYEWMLTQKRETEVLPVTLKYFKASVLSNNTVSLGWESTYEKNNRDYIIERSSNETDFYQVNTVPGTNQSTGDLYNWVDNHPFSGDNYYRLSQIDLDGTKTIFDIVKVSVREGNASVKAYPNPVLGSTLNITISGKLDHSYHVKIYDGNGRVLFSNIYRLSSNSIQINPQHLSPGLNVIEVRSPEIHKIVSVTKL